MDNSYPVFYVLIGIAPSKQQWDIFAALYQQFQTFNNKNMFLLSGKGQF